VLTITALGIREAWTARATTGQPIRKRIRDLIVHIDERDYRKTEDGFSNLSAYAPGSRSHRAVFAKGVRPKHELSQPFIEIVSSVRMSGAGSFFNYIGKLSRVRLFKTCAQNLRHFRRSSRCCRLEHRCSALLPLLWRLHLVVGGSSGGSVFCAFRLRTGVCV
jgi:hypothetical protein